MSILNTPILKAEIRQTSMTGQSLFILRKPEDQDFAPAVQQQFPTDVAQYLKRLIDHDQTEVTFERIQEESAVLLENLKAYTAKLVREANTNLATLERLKVVTQFLDLVDTNLSQDNFSNLVKSR